MKEFFDRQFNLIFLLIVLIELISFAGHFFSLVNTIVFFVLAILVLIASFYKLEYGLAILLAELFIGSMGYLFSFSFHGINISLRIIIWLIVMLVWFSKITIFWIKNKKLSITFHKSSFFPYFIILFVFIVFGIINGFINHNQLKNIFFDFNSWLYFLLIFPIYEVLQQEKNIKLIGQVFIASSIWLIFETLFLFFAFSHNLIIAPFVLYYWIRNTRIGEITMISGGFPRIFLQSQIFVLVCFFFVSTLLAKLIINKELRQRLNFFIINLVLLILSLATILISFSRSFWLGLIGGVLICWIVWLLIIKIKFKQFLLINCWWLSVAISSILLIIMIAKFPYPTSTGNFDAVNLLSDRASQLAGEAGASSRWALLPKLWTAIAKSPIVGQGFGATVTYQSKDPRVLEIDPSGKYTTYAFEWGWLDVWLKLGIFGLLAYLAIIVKILIVSYKLMLQKQNWLIFSLAIGLLVIATVNLSSPYFNHPLGIGYLILTTALVDYFYQQKACYQVGLSPNTPHLRGRKF
ncbi:MAG: O-antigen ligase family protein [Patescibacteria group bacterium]|nr:O-antigen ligase family protein [Patescibacteria group bacterium]MBU1783356.1 O-antigen ligase family protein [Patescibacteria group bacterium]MBU2081579.1 O-antigen ligase family protein [Patescibacteria group bacterium]MBU2214814.1 O-antigen ligase family protein [Patescibacteria group bacterium]MBU2250481.1 O-antigen ligase family protein [Patescibacteria group bacterium]